MTLFYVLDEAGNPQPELDAATWARRLTQTNRTVAKSAYGNIVVSTVFLGINHDFSNEGPPLLYETMVFGGALDGTCRRYATRAEAEAGHAALLADVESRCPLCGEVSYAGGIKLCVSCWYDGAKNFDVRFGQVYRAFRLMVPPKAVVRFTYTNHRGETAERTVRPQTLRYGTSEHHPKACFLLEAHDFARNATRTFDLERITSAWTEVPPYVAESVA